MKKNNLFKILALIMVVIALLTWFIPAGYYQSEFIESGINRLGFVDFCQYLVLPFFQSMFLEVLIFLLSVGAFYGVLSKTGVYKTSIEEIAKKFKKKGNLALIVIAFILGALSSFGGYGLLLFIFIPAIISIVLLMGYDRITALLVTFGAMLVGVIGTTYGSNYISQILASLGLTYNSQILYKVILFVLSLIVLLLFALKFNKGKERNSDFEDTFLGKGTSKRKPIMIYVAFGVLFVLLILGCTNWNDVFGIEVFSKFHSWLTGLSIGEFKVISSIFGGGLTEFGSWSYFQLSVVLLVVAFILAKIYNVKYIPSIVDGIKVLIKPALLVIFAYGVLILIVNSGVFVTLLSYVFKVSSKFNILGFLISVITNILGSFLHVELPYVANFYLPYLISNYSETVVPALMNVMVQGLYGLTMFVAPTSLFLILGLTYLNVPYIKWLKNVWKLVIALFLLILIILVIMLIIL